MKFKWLLLLLPLIQCTSQETPSFKEWYAEHRADKSFKPTNRMLQERTFTSSKLLIDSIYKSMQGPFKVEVFDFKTDADELVWLVGYESKLIDAEEEKELPAKFMCHNNLNFLKNQDAKWHFHSDWQTSRLFTLSEGQTKLRLPEGFGIPIHGSQNLEVVSQVLNHKEDSINLVSRHQVNFKYYKDSELSKPLTPLYQQSLFITKQLSGPAGKYGVPHSCKIHDLDSNEIKGEEPVHSCEADFISQSYNPYQDAYGRKYTGHWRLPYGREQLTTEVTPMLALENDSRIHMISVHLHPYAEGLELWDISTDSLLYSVDLTPKEDGFGFKKIGYYKSAEGIPVYKDHRYELKSTYNCTDSTEINTAMAVMYVYLSGKN